MRARFINETYASNTELVLLSDDIIKIINNYINENNITEYDYIERFNTSYSKIQDWMIYFENIFNKIDKAKYNTIKDFLNTKMFFLIFGRGGAHYNTLKKSIFIGIDHNDGINSSYTAEILVHEMQHAYDDFRSNGKFTKTKENRYRIKQHKLHNKYKLIRSNYDPKIEALLKSIGYTNQAGYDNPEISDEFPWPFYFQWMGGAETNGRKIPDKIKKEIKKLTDKKNKFSFYGNNYHNQPHEISAITAQLMFKMRKGEYGSFQEVIDDIEPYSFSDKRKMTVIKKLSQYWHKEKEI